MKPSAPSQRCLEAAHPWFELFRVVSFNPTSAMFEMLFSQKKPKSLGPSFLSAVSWDVKRTKLV